MLRPWGHARERTVVAADGAVTVRLDRAGAESAAEPRPNCRTIPACGRFCRRCQYAQRALLSDVVDEGAGSGRADAEFSAERVG
ncbi:hypothetical protein [Saccharopolyspora hattusasensis]|uniref:hypothetical protein n=1 Tax=Saccharopolyspora hattusasensis TaxID=1128679 RepID=UPI003D956C69